jgi:predicted enzyme related to lactoylglutathione lyase
MRRVTGIGGIFFKAQNPEKLRAWYRDHLGIDVQLWGGAAFRWADAATADKPGTTVWSIMPQDSNYFAPSSANFMINYRVENLDQVLTVLREEGCVVDDHIEASEFGRFGWVMDPEGNRVELWEPPSGTLPE